MASLIGIATLLAGGYYVARVVPRAAARAAAASSGTAACSSKGPLRYKAYDVCGFQSTMTEREALLILGFDASSSQPQQQQPTPQAIKERYRQVMSFMHSDVEGSSLLAAKVNEARDLLVKKSQGN